MLKPLSYVVVTPARNEARSIELTLKSVTKQTALPLRWVIVNDGSTDGTDEIVRQYQKEHQWIDLFTVADRKERHFAGKVHAFNAGWARVKDLSYDVIVSLDADIEFEEDYMEFLLEKLAVDPGLGLVGTPFQETGTEVYDYRYVNIEHVSGACQVFRRECFESIGGYIPVQSGAIDNIAVISCRMKGWKTRTFTEKICMHHRAMGTAQNGRIKAKFKFGAKDYNIGNHPLWEVFRCAYQMTRRPFVVGGLAVAAGYFSTWVKRKKRPVSAEFVAFHRREQMDRLARFCRRIFAKSTTWRATTATMEPKATQEGESL